MFGLQGCGATIVPASAPPDLPDAPEAPPPALPLAPPDVRPPAPADCPAAPPVPLPFAEGEPQPANNPSDPTPTTSARHAEGWQNRTTADPRELSRAVTRGLYQAWRVP